MRSLSPSATLRQLQEHIANVEQKYGFADETMVQKCLLLGEEVGELFKSIRMLSGIGVDVNSVAHDVGEELADVLAFVLAIANRTGVDLGTAFMEKQKTNETRTWRNRVIE
jgi:NTP pyrophosphatase (non-canonical NTP hydrolase)